MHDGGKDTATAEGIPDETCEFIVFVMEWTDGDDTCKFVVVEWTDGLMDD